MRNLRKTLSLLLLSFIVFTFVPQVAYADEQEAVTTVNLNFRDQGTIYSNVIGVVPTGSTLKVLGTSGNWTEVEYNGQTGWVSSKYIRPLDEIAAARTITNLRTAVLRAERSSSSEALARIKVGSVASLLEIEGLWYKVDFDGKIGYVLASSWIDTPAGTKPVVSETPAPTAGIIDIYADVPVYMNASDAQAQKNTVGTYASGEYHIYRSFSGMLNITRFENVPGAWINPGQNTDEAPAPEQPAEPQPQPEPSETAADTYELVTSVAVYVTADEAMSGTNAVGQYHKGTYFIFKEFSGSLNLTKVKGEPGAWIDPAANVLPEAETPEEPPVEDPVTPEEPPVEDPVTPEEPEDTIVTNSSVNVRKGPSNAFEILRTLPAGTNAIMIGRESNWLKIEYKDQIGYSYINYWNVPEKTLDKFTPKPEPSEPAPAPEPNPEEQPVTSGKLKVFLDPGHNGIGQGAVSTVTGELVDETTINYRVAILAKEILEDRGYEVYLSKSSLNEAVTLTERTDRANQLGVDIFVSIHCNAYTDPSAKGTIGFYGGEKLNPATSDWQAKSMLLSQKLAESVGSIIGSSKIVKDTSYGRSFAVNRLSTMPSTLLELGFITNYQDAMILNSAANQKDLAREVANGIDKYFGK